MYVHINHAFLQNQSSLSFYLTTAILNDYYSKVMVYTVLALPIFMKHMDAKVTPTDDTYYSYHIKQ